MLPPAPTATIIRPGDLFGLLTILELAETGYIRPDALFATSPDGIIVEFDTTYGRRERRTKRKPTRGRSRPVSRCGCEDRKGGEDVKITRRGSDVSVSAKSRMSASASTTYTSRSSSRSSSVSAVSSCSSISSSSPRDQVQKHTSKPSSSPTRSASSPERKQTKSISSSLERKPNSSRTSQTTSQYPEPFVYTSPNTKETTTINPKDPSSVPADVASEAINALIGRLDQIMEEKKMRGIMT